MVSASFTYQDWWTRNERARTSLAATLPEMDTERLPTSQVGSPYPVVGQSKAASALQCSQLDEDYSRLVEEILGLLSPEPMMPMRLGWPG